MSLGEIGRRYDEAHDFLERDAVNMHRAVELARVAVREDQEPFGCIIADRHGIVVGEGRGTGTDANPLLHSECTAIIQACFRTRGLLRGCTLYSTHEPCPMCCGAINHAEVARVIFGSYRVDVPGRFRTCSVHWRKRLADTSHPPAVIPGVLRDICAALWEGRDQR